MARRGESGCPPPARNFAQVSLTHVPSSLTVLQEETLEELVQEPFDTLQHVYFRKRGKQNNAVEIKEEEVSREEEISSKVSEGERGFADEEDNTVLYSRREGLGSATNNVAEYRALNLGLECALNKGFKNVRVQGDSQLVCKQVQGAWATKHPNMTQLCGQAQELMSQFNSCDIQHVPREFNSAADAQASLATNLAEGQSHEESSSGYGRRGY